MSESMKTKKELRCCLGCGRDTRHDYCTRCVGHVTRKRDAPEDAPRTMRVEYHIGWKTYISEWVCFEHTGYARAKAEAWWRQRSDDPVPATADEAVELAQAGSLSPTLAVQVRRIAGDKYDRIIAHRLGDKPPSVTGGDLAAPLPEFVLSIPDDEIPF